MIAMANRPVEALTAWQLDVPSEHAGIFGLFWWEPLARCIDRTFQVHGGFLTESQRLSLIPSKSWHLTDPRNLVYGSIWKKLPSHLRSLPSHQSRIPFIKPTRMNHGSWWNRWWGWPLPARRRRVELPSNFASSLVLSWFTPRFVALWSTAKLTFCLWHWWEPQVNKGA